MEEDMRDNTYGAMQFEDDYQVRALEQKEFDALNLAINHLRKTRLVYSQFIPKSKVKEKIEELEKEYEKYTGFYGLEFSRTGLINAQIQKLQELLD